MVALMYDSDSETYPDGVNYIAAYVDGSRTGRNLQRARAQNPDAKFLTISAVGQVDADVIDIEPGNVWPPENAVPWIRRQLDRGHVPMYYCNTSTRQQCIDAFRAAGLPELPWWRADYRPPSQRPASFALGEEAHQFADPPMTGAHWDVSVISPDVKAYLDGHSDVISGDVQDVTPIEPGGDAPQPSDPSLMEVGMFFLSCSGGVLLVGPGYAKGLTGDEYAQTAQNVKGIQLVDLNIGGAGDAAADLILSAFVNGYSSNSKADTAQGLDVTAIRAEIPQIPAETVKAIAEKLAV